MRHGVKLNRLSRTSSHRKALMKNLGCQIIEHKRIVTTLAKAKALRVYIEPLLTKSKTDNTTNRRVVFAKLQNKEAIKELFSTVSEKIATRNGGYTRIIKLQPRVGDAAEMALIELVDFNEIYTGSGAAVGEEKKKTRRSRSAGTTKAKAAPTVAINTESATSVDTASEVVTESAVVEAAAVTEVLPVVEDTAAVAVEAQAVENKSVAVEAETVVEESAASTSANDDLTIVEGIGPKIAELFNNKGITTFVQLAATSAEDMKAMLVEAGPSYAGKDPSTWAQQSQLAADGKFDELKAWQDELNGGKEA
jgi:large subunit ribosomal protein L17